MGLVLVFYNSDLSFPASWQVVLMVHDPVGKYFPVAPGWDLWGAAAMLTGRRCLSPVLVAMMYRLMTDEDDTAFGYDGWASRSLVRSSVLLWRSSRQTCCIILWLSSCLVNFTDSYMMELRYPHMAWTLVKTVSMYSKYSLLIQLYVTSLRLDSNMLFSWICKYPLRLAYGKLSVSVSIISCHEYLRS